MEQYIYYLILDIGKIFIKRSDNKKEYYKEVDNKIINLKDKELEYINKIFDIKKFNEYYNEFDLKTLIENNHNIENKEYINNFFMFLDRIIPENCKENFYRNIKTVKIKLNFDTDFSKIDDNTINKKEYTTTAGYNTKKNSLTILPETLKMIFEIAKDTKDPNDFFWKQVNVDILHELAHMASTKYDEETDKSLCGFDSYPYRFESDKNRGLTEGMTEVIAMTGVPGTVEISSGYYIEALFINQLIQIVGSEVMLSSYFTNKGTKEIENSLNNILDEPVLSNTLFRKIEDNFYLRDVNCKQTLLANIQLILIDYFEKKLIQDIKNNKSIEIIETSINFFEQMLITPEKLKLMNKIPENYIGLNDSIKKFSELKNNILLPTTNKSK